MFKIIDELKRADPERRQKLLVRMQEKNYNYLKKVNPDLAEFIKQRGTGDYGIRITDKSLEVFRREDNQLFHPPGQLFEYMADFGYWHHSAWVDKMAIAHYVRSEGRQHAEFVVEFINAMYEEMPELKQRMESMMASLPKMRDGRRYSGPVVFLGIFTGLHIMNYLNRTVVRDIFLIEPDMDKFAISCFFLDYELIEKHYGHIFLHVGPNPPQMPIDQLTVQAPISASTWVRLLPAYESKEFDQIIDRIALRWRALNEVFVPMDRELGNLVNGMKNIKAQLPFPYKKPEVSTQLTIAVVASGPSLEKDMEWLKRNQNRLLVFTSISCARVLQANGIRIDFQCTLDTELDEELFKLMKLDPKVPLVAYYKLNPELAKRFEKVFLLPEDNKANAVRFKQSFLHTHPTTGNLTTAFAAWCNPSTLIFLGLDFGFRDPKRSHVKGGWHDENDGIGHEAETASFEHIPAAANFPESEGEILSIGYYNSARFTVEGCIAAMQGKARVLNFADGAKIQGAAPTHSEDFTLPEYPQRESDFAAICAGFSSDYGDAFEAYTLSGREMIKEFKSTLIKNLELQKPFDWPEWSAAIDRAMEQVYVHFARQHEELRVEIYAKVVIDLLSDWYRIMTLAESIKEAEFLYKKGLAKLAELIEKLPWSDELDMPEAIKKKSRAGNKKSKTVAQSKQAPG